jgi:predicted nuclease with TOPRIM domain
MSKESNPSTKLEAARAAIAQLLQQAHQQEQHLQAQRQKIYDYQLAAEKAFLEHVSNLWQLRSEVIQLVHQVEELEVLDEDTMAVLRFISEDLNDLPLFHPHYEKLLEARAAAPQQNGQTIDQETANRIKDRLDSFSDYPGELEIEAGKTALQALARLGKSQPGMDIEMALQGILLPASALLEAGLESLGEAPALALLHEQEKGLKAFIARLEKESQLLASSDTTRMALENQPLDQHEDITELQVTLNKVKAALEDTIHRGAPSPLFDELADEYAYEDEEEEQDAFRDRQVGAFLNDMLDETEGLFYGGGFEDDFLYEMMEDDYELEIHENPRFPLGSSVKVIADHLLENDPFGINLKGLQGRLTEAFHFQESTLYTLQLDSISLRSLPEAFVRKCCEDEYGSFTNYEMLEDILEPAEPRDTPEEATTAHRHLFHYHFWGDVESNDAAARIYRIMMKSPARTDIDNWLDYFAKQVQFPFDAQVEGLIFQNIEPGTRVEVLGIEGNDPEDEFGLIASIRKGRAILSYPLCELMPLFHDDPKGQALNDYRLWADFMI